jgi:hypothetical protein
MLMVGTVPDTVDTDLRSGRLACPDCRGPLAPWGWARERTLRLRGSVVRLRPRRSVCLACGATHVLLPDLALWRRGDAAAVIGEALVAKASGSGHRRIAVLLGRPPSTVRGWLRRFAERAEWVRVLFSRLLVALDPQVGPLLPRGSALADAVEVLGRAAAAAVRRLGPCPPWSFAARATAGRLLAPVPAGRTINTS